MFRKMKFFIQSNIDQGGRLIRFVIGLICLFVGIIVLFYLKWLFGLIFIIAGLFVIFEAATKWCVMRACGIKTKF